MPCGHTTFANSEDCAGIQTTNAAVILKPALEAATLEAHECQLETVVVFGIEERGKAVEFDAAVMQVADVADIAGCGSDPVKVCEVLTHSVD